MKSYLKMSKKQKEFIEKLALETNTEIDWYKCVSMDQASMQIRKLIKLKNLQNKPKQIIML